MEAEDARRPNREHDRLKKETTRLVNRAKAALARWGVRGFNPKLRKAVDKLEGLATPDGALWYTGQMANILGRLDPSTGAIKEYPLKTPASGPHGLVDDKACVLVRRNQIDEAGAHLELVRHGAGRR